MARIVLELGLLYLLPFLIYFLYLVARRAYVLSLDHWTRRVIASLSLAGLALIFGGLLLTGFYAARHQGVYVPAHIEDGVLVPGRMQ